MMGWRIVNQTPHLLILPLNSGKAVYLAPNEISPLLEHAEINGNAKVDKLLVSKSITVVEEKIREPAAAPHAKAHRKATQPVEGTQQVEREPERERARKKK